MLKIDHIVIFVLFFVFFSNSQAQYADCSKMLHLTDTFYQAKNISGYGDNLEFESNDLYDSLNFEIEKNTIWYLISIPYDGELSFDILSLDEGNDWDFLLFEHKNLFCKRIDAKKITPIRSNLSRSANTGISKDGNMPFVAAGINDNYSKSLLVKKDEQYVLVVNNSKRAGGSHSLTINVAGEKPEVKIEEPIAETNFLSLSIEIKDKTTNKPVAGNIIIDGLRKKLVEKNNIMTYAVDVPQRKYKLTISTNSPGYLIYSEEVTITSNRTTFSQTVLLEKIQKGRKVNLRNIQFYGNQAKFLPQASGDLKALLAFMEINKNVKIEVEGHVNGPNQRNTKDYQTLSEDRAKAVKEYLIENGIEATRIASIGYGNTQMLHPNPKSEVEMSANRRVEIKIMEN